MNRTWRYLTIAGTFWRDRKIHSLSEDGRTLAAYFLTCPERTTEGFYSLPRVLILDDLGWGVERFGVARAELQDEGFAHYDSKAEVVFIVKGLKYNAPRGARSIRGAINTLGSTQDAPELFNAYLGAADHYAPELADAIRGHYGIAA